MNIEAIRKEARDVYLNAIGSGEFPRSHERGIAATVEAVLKAALDTLKKSPISAEEGGRCGTNEGVWFSKGYGAALTRLASLTTPVDARVAMIEHVLATADFKYGDPDEQRRYLCAQILAKLDGMKP